MKHETVRTTAFAMPLTNPAFPPGPYRFINREYFIIQYRTDPEALRRVVPEPLELAEPVVNYEFIRMPTRPASATTPKAVRSFRCPTRARPAASPIRCFSMIIRRLPAGVTVGLSQEAGAAEAGRRDRHAGRHLELRLGSHRDRHDGLQAPRPRRRGRSEEARSTQLPAQDHPACRRHAARLRLVRFHLEDIIVKGAWTGPAALDLYSHALAPSPNCRCFRCCRPSTSLPI